MGHFFGNKSWYRWIGKWIYRFNTTIFGDIDFQGDPQARNKVDYFARFWIVFAFGCFVIAYLVATVPQWSVDYMV